MALSIRNGHIGEALRWSGAEPITGRTIAIAALGMAGPVLLGFALGRPAVGFTIGLGAMLLADTPAAGAAAEDKPSPGSAIGPAALAVILATLIAGTPWSDGAMIALAGLAATVSGYSRPVGVAAIRFIIYLVLSDSLLESAGDHRTGAALIFGLGALWNVAVRMMLAGPKVKAPPAAPPTRTPTAAQRRAYFRRTLQTLAGWQFTVRMVVGLGVASLLRHLWPSHHFGWIVLTVALLTQRPLEHLPVKITQRALGTALGVLMTWLILVGVPSHGWRGLVICLLATAAALARARNYLAYAVIATPVILLVMDMGKPLEASLLTDRLIATALGAAIVLAGNVALDALIRAVGAEPPRRARPAAS
jgi:hypothetical protein